MDLETLERAAKADPKNAAAQLAFGEALLQANRAGEALEPLRRALLLERDRLEAYLALGQALLAEEEHVAAIATLEGGREMAAKAGRAELVARFDASLQGLGPVKRRDAAPLDESAFDTLARGELAGVAERLRALGRGVAIQQTPGVLVLEVRGKAKMGLSVQKSSREIWSSSALGELRFRHIPSSKHWRAAEGEELVSTIDKFLSLQLGEAVRLP
jgi:frataxin-like iron-binding protein CyaY